MVHAGVGCGADEKKRGGARRIETNSEGHCTCTGVVGEEHIWVYMMPGRIRAKTGVKGEGRLG